MTVARSAEDTSNIEPAAFDAQTSIWLPSPDVIAATNVTAACQELGFADYDALYRWSIGAPEGYWAYVMARLSIQRQEPGQEILRMLTPTHPLWLPDSRMSIVDSCFQADGDSPAVVYSDGEETLQAVTVSELAADVEQVASSFRARGVSPGERVAVILPMSPIAIAVFLGIIAAGAAVVCIPESFAANEMAVRLRIAGATLAITQDVIVRGSKTLPLYERVREAAAVPVIVIGDNGEPVATLSDSDVTWSSFLCSRDSFTPVERAPQEPICVLFSSGTTGEPKAIPWDHTTPIKCAADGHFHQDIHAGDVVCWPTSLGWMMGPWLIFAALINRATIAIYGQSPLSPEFGQFIEEAKVTILGTVPSMVRSWRLSRCMEAFNWSRIRLFSSTGECSNALDSSYLMRLGGNKPVIEYCGGTEIGGAYITSVIVKPNMPATFNTPALGIAFDLLDESREVPGTGEVFLKGQSMGLSTKLINQDHDAVYFAGNGFDELGNPRRRHGDELASLPGGYFQMLGRCDDTMNLGGIKVGCVEIERVAGRVAGVLETAAVAASDPEGGPSRLIIFAVLQPQTDMSPVKLKELMQQEIKKELNPLFHVSAVKIVASLPRTASGKVMRRSLRQGFAPNDN